MQHYFVSVLTSTSSLSHFSSFSHISPHSSSSVSFLVSLSFLSSSSLPFILSLFQQNVLSFHHCSTFSFLIPIHSLFLFHPFVSYFLSFLLSSVSSTVFCVLLTGSRCCCLSSSWCSPCQACWWRRRWGRWSWGTWSHSWWRRCPSSGRPLGRLTGIQISEVKPLTTVMFVYYLYMWKTHHRCSSLPLCWNHLLPSTQETTTTHTNRKHYINKVLN